MEDGFRMGGRRTNCGWMKDWWRVDNGWIEDGDGY
jgi:hypothetical protein